MEKRNEPVSDTANREILTVRLLRAPIELVYRAFTEPKHLAHWWGPNGFTLTFHEHELRTGGTWRFTMHGPNGDDYPNLISYEEVVPNKKLVYWHGSGMEDETGKFHVTITFTARGEMTEVSMRGVFRTPEELAYVIKEHHALEASKQIFDKLEAYLAKMQ